MRCYYFVNMYLSDIQRGIQPLHVTHELFTKYPKASLQKKWLHAWATDHKTVIVLNGGYASAIQTVYDQMSQQNMFPCAKFHEEEASLNGALTCAGIVLPEYIYGSAAKYRRLGLYNVDDVYDANENEFTHQQTEGEPDTATWLTPWEIQFALTMNNFSLA